ncbi:hypothetical protein KY328_01120, partial [Candidatus Woesearchaeota archaeon]|nr:hypothetical protein [Candidatus Woesearchaeota archaeon]
MNKKAVMVITLMVVGVVIAFIAFSVVNLSDDLAGKSVSYIGAKELTIARLQMRSQEDLLFVDQSARLAAYKSVFNLADLGGFRASSPCGVYDNYNLWNNKTDKCYPTKTELGEALVNDFRFNFNQYRSLLQKRNLLASYTYFYKDGDIIGVADTNFIYDKPVKDFILSVNPSFREKIDF